MSGAVATLMWRSEALAPAIASRTSRISMSPVASVRVVPANRAGARVRDGPSARIDQEQGLAVLDGLSVVDQDAHDAPPDFGLDLVHQLHGLDDADGLAEIDLRVHLDVRIGVGR